MWDLSSPTSSWAHISCTAQWILYHWTTREVLRIPCIWQVTSLVAFKILSFSSLQIMYLGVNLFKFILLGSLLCFLDSRFHVFIISGTFLTIISSVILPVSFLLPCLWYSDYMCDGMHGGAPWSLKLHSFFFILLSSPQIAYWIKSPMNDNHKLLLGFTGPQFNNSYSYLT